MSESPSISKSSKSKIRKTKKIGVYRSSSNLINAVLGSGVLSIPKELENSGFFIGIFLLVFVCIISDFTSIQLVKMAKIKKVDSFEKLSEKAWGMWLYYISCVCNFLFPFGALIAYVKIINSSNESIMGQYFGPIVSRHSYLPFLGTLACLFLIALPLSLLKDLALLSFTSILSVGTFIIIMIITTATGISMGNYRTTFTQIKPKGFLSAVGTLSFSLVCVDVLLPVYAVLDNRTQKRWNKVTHLSIGILGSIYGIFSILCYFLIPDLSDYVLNSPSITKRPEIVACKILLNFTLLLTYPVVLHVSRSYIFSMFEPLLGPIHLLPNSKFYTLHFGVTALILLLSILMGLFAESLSLVVSLTGLTACAVIGFVVPVAIIFRIRTFRAVWIEFKAALCGSSSPRKAMTDITNFVFPFVVLLFGITAFFIGTPLKINSYLEKKN